MRKTVIDMTHTLNNETEVWPGTPSPKFEQVYSVKDGDYAQITKIQMTTHTGTHIDCNTHTNYPGYTVDTQDMGFFIGNGLVIDCRGKEKKENPEELGMDIFDGVDLTDVDFIFPYLGWADKWGTDAFFGELFPCFDEEVITFLANHETIRGVGLETPGVDPVRRDSLDIHKIYFQKEKTLIENLTNVDKLIGKKFTFVALPLKIQGAEGSPVRAVAILED